MHQRPVGGVHLVDQDEPQREERRHEDRPLSLHGAGGEELSSECAEPHAVARGRGHAAELTGTPHSPGGEPEGRHGEERAEVLEELSGPGELHGHLPLPHLVLHQDLTLQLQGKPLRYHVTNAARHGGAVSCRNAKQDERNHLVEIKADLKKRAIKLVGRSDPLTSAERRLKSFFLPVSTRQRSFPLNETPAMKIGKKRQFNESCFEQLKPFKVLNSR